MYNAIVIAGPTAVGKTELSIKLAKLLNAQIISSDASQVYKGLDIGTAKIREVEKKGVIHHLIDIVEPNEEYNAGLFYKQANEILNKNKDKIFLIVGGTGLYIDALVEGLAQLPEIDRKKRKELEEKSLEELQEMLTIEEKNSIDIKNKIRVIRKIELRGLNLNKVKANDRKFLKIFLERDRKNLYNRINYRVDCMMKEGLLDEAKKIYNRYGNINIKSIGYKELFEYFEEKISLEEAIEKIKIASRRYAKRQFTWFRDKGYIRYNMDNKNMDDIIEDIRRNYGN